MKARWYIHVLGPDDILFRDDEITALREANNINSSIASNRVPGDFYTVALVKQGNPWPDEKEHPNE